MPITAVDAARARISHLDAVGRLFRLLVERGASVPATEVRAYQRGWNGRWQQIQEALALQGMHALANTLRELVEDGRWGPNTAYTTAIWISPSIPPASASQFPAWWQANGSIIRARVDTLYRSDRAIIDAAERPIAPPPPPDLPPVTEATTPTITDPTTDFEERYERRLVEGSTSRTASGGSRGSGGAVLGLALIAGLGYLAYRSGALGVVDFMGTDEEDCGCGG